MDAKTDIVGYLPMANTLAIVIALIYFHRTSVDQKSKTAELESKLTKLEAKLKSYAKYNSSKIKKLEQSATSKSFVEPIEEDEPFQDHDLMDSLGLQQ